MILLVVVIIFGAGKLPEVGNALGRGIREFKEQATGWESVAAAAQPVAAAPPTHDNRELRADQI